MDHLHLSYTKHFLIKKKRSETSLLASLSAWFLKKIGDRRTVHIFILGSVSDLESGLIDEMRKTLTFQLVDFKTCITKSIFVFLVYVSINLTAFFSNKFFPFFILRYMKLAFSCFWKANLIFRKFFVIKFLPFLPSDRFILEYFSYKTFINQQNELV